MTLQTVTNIYVRLSLLTPVIGLLLIPVRLQGFTLGSVELELLLLSLVQLTFVFGLGLAIALSRKLDFQPHFLELVLIAFPVMIVPYSLLNGYDPLRIVIDAARPGLFLVNVILFSRIFPYADRAIFTRWLAFVMLAGTASVSYSFIFLFGIGLVKESASDISLVMPFLFFVVLRKWPYIAMGLVALLIGGKLGPAFSAAFALGLYVVARHRIVLALAPIIFAVLFIGLEGIQFIYGSEALSNVGIIAKTRFLASGGDIFDMDLLDQFFLGGRIEEATRAIEPLETAGFNPLVGMGPGFTYTSSIDGAGGHGVHFTPLSICTFYGVGYFVVLFILLVRTIFDKFLSTVASDQSDKFVAAAALFGSAFLLNSLSAYTIFISPQFALTLGILRWAYLERRRQAPESAAAGPQEPSELDAVPAGPLLPRRR